MKKIVVCGATSMLGLSLIDECIKSHTSVLAIIRRNSFKRELLPKSDLICVVECGIDELSSLTDYEDDYDCFYYFMWQGTRGGDRNDADLQKKNIGYCIDAIELASRLGCKKFIGSGSQAEYGIVDGLIDENTKTDPISEYGRAKLEAYEQCLRYSQENGIAFNWVRVLSVYGPNDDKNTLISMLINRMVNREKIELTGCQQIWDYLYSDDAGRAFYLLGERGQDKKVYVLGSGRPKRLKDYVETIKNKIDKNAIISYGAIPYGKDQVMYLVADISSIRKDTGWEPKVCFEEGIDRILHKVKR